MDIKDYLELLQECFDDFVKKNFIIEHFPSFSIRCLLDICDGLYIRGMLDFCKSKNEHYQIMRELERGERDG